METDLSLIEISAVDDSLLIPTAGDVSASGDVSTSVTGFSCSPLLQIPRSITSLRRPPLPPSRFESVKSVDGARNSTRDGVDDKENSHLNKTEVAKLSLDPHQMKRKKKGGAYNLRKSLAWDRAFFTEEGVLDPLELSMLSGNSGGDLLSVIHEGGESTCASEDSVSESTDLQALKENLCKGLTKSSSQKGKNIVGTSSPNPGSSLAKEKTKRKLLSAQDSNRIAPKCSGRPTPVPSSSLKRIQNFNLPKVATKNSKEEKVLALKKDACGVPTTSTCSTDRSSRLKHKQIAQPVKSRKNIGLKATSTNAKNVAHDRKFGPAGKMVSRSNPQQARRNVSNPAEENLLSTKLNKPQGNQTNNGSMILLDSVLPAACHSQTNHDGDPSVVSTPSSQSSTCCGGNIKDTQIPTAKPSGLRLPSPSMGFFHQSRSVKQSLLQRTSASYNVPNSSILNQRKPSSSNSRDEGNRQPLGSIPSGLIKEKRGASFSSSHPNAKIYDMDDSKVQMKGDELLLQSDFCQQLEDDNVLAEDNCSIEIDAAVKIQDSIPSNLENFHDPSSYDGAKHTIGSSGKIDDLTGTLNMENAKVQFLDNNLSVENNNGTLGTSTMVNQHSDIFDGLSEKSSQQSETACTETEQRESSGFNTAGKIEGLFVDNALACSADPELAVEHLRVDLDFQSNSSVSESMSIGKTTDAAITYNLEATGVCNKTKKSAQQSEIACTKTEREYSGVNTAGKIEGLFLNVALAGSVDPESAVENPRVDLDFQGVSNCSVEGMIIGNMTDAITTDNIAATGVCQKSEKVAEQFEIAWTKAERREYTGLNTAGKIEGLSVDNAPAGSVDPELTIENLGVDLDLDGVSNSSLLSMSIDNMTDAATSNNIEVSVCNTSKDIGDSEGKPLHFSHQLCPFEQVNVASGVKDTSECSEVHKQFSTNFVAFSTLQPGTDICHDEKSISIALDDTSKGIDDLSEHYGESINPVDQCYIENISETMTNDECESIRDQIFNQSEILEQASDSTGVQETNKETGIEEVLVHGSRRKSIAYNCNMNLNTSTTNTIFLSVTGDNDKRLEECTGIQNSKVSPESDGLDMDSKLPLMNVELVDSENRHNNKNGADFSEKGDTSSDESKCFDVSNEAPPAIEDVCLNMEKNYNHPCVLQTIPGAIYVEQSSVGVYVNTECVSDKLGDQATSEYDPFSNNSGDQVPLLATDCAFKPFFSIDKPEKKMDETSNGSIFQDMEVNLLQTDNLRDEAETRILENTSFLDSEMQDELNVEISHEEDNNKRRSLKRLANDEKKDELVIKPPPNAAPFSDEWLAAFEGAGEEILKMKGGAVQNSPPDKSLPEPSPWSPVKKKNNQGIGPFDCTKYSNTNIAHPDPN